MRRGLIGAAVALALPAMASQFGAAKASAELAAKPPANLTVTPRLKPPPPGPAFLSPADLERLKDAREAVERRNWTTARAIAADVADPIARSLAEWFIFYAEDPEIGLAEADAFLDAHPDWPALTKIQGFVEKRIPQNAPSDLILDFFATRDPVTGEGEIELARAQFAAGAPEAGAIHVRNAWIKHNFTLHDERLLVQRYGEILTPEDHAARVDRLLWDREVTTARRVFSKLSRGERRKAEARAALLMRASNAPKLLEALSAEDRLDPGVLLASVRYYRRQEEEPLAISLARLAPSEPEALRNPSAWWSERQLLMRWALKERQYADAYAMAAGHGLNIGNDFAEAEFAAGWIALRFLNAPERAETHFKALANSVGAPISLARAQYWLARAAEARSLPALARERYSRAAQFIYTYYGQLAAEKAGAPLAAQTFASPVTPTPEERARFSSRPVVAALRMLSDLGADHEFLVFAYQADDVLQSAGEYVELARLADRLGATHVAVRAGKVGAGRNAFAAEVAYPLVFVPDEAMRFAPAEIILGLSRQESEFNPRAYSSAGARGLMQLVPSTAQITARKAGLRYNRSALLDDPVYNMIIGSAHLSHLFERFGGSFVMTLAAYNAGARRVEEWVERYGDPRVSDIDPVDWVEQIPFAETRNYVQRVLENAQIYRARLTSAPIAGRLAADLERGGPRGRVGALAGADYAGALPPLPERTVRLANAAPAGSAAHTKPADPAASVSAGSTPAETSAPQTLPKPAKTRLQKATPATPIAAVAEPSPAAAQTAPAAVNAATPAPLPDAAAGVNHLTPIEPPTALAQEVCETYRAYIAATAGQEANAADLNVGMLAELRTGGAPCEASADAAIEDRPPSSIN